MKTRIYFLIGILFFCLHSEMYGQNSFFCGSDEHREELLKNNTNYSQGYYKSLDKIDKWIAENQYNGQSWQKANYSLPVVIHIIAPPGTLVGSGNNIAYSDVLKGLENLNAVFANKGVYETPDGVDTGIEFCLAKRTPDGKPFDGITRHYDSVVGDTDPCDPGTNMLNDGIVKSFEPWDCCQYINIWLVTDLYDGNSCSLLGYATLPSGNCAGQGIVQESAYWVSQDGALVTAHEMGHYLGLYHTFEGGCINSNCNFDGDRVCDTPPDDAQFAPCDANTCSTDSPDLQDDNTNIMDYSNCKPIHFTQGQTDRMKGTLETTRSCILDSEACISPVNNDVGIYDLTLDKEACGFEICPVLNLTNTGLDNLDGIVITYTLDGAVDFTYNYPNTLAAGQSEIVALPCVSAPLGAHTFDVTVGLTNQTDEYADNNYQYIQFTTIEAPELALVSVTGTNCVSDGSIELSVSGGQPPYTYSISTAAFIQTSPIFNNLIFGQHIIKVLDANNCEDVIIVDVPDNCTSTNPADFVTNGNAIHTGDNCYQITDALNTQAGSVWYSELVNLNESFDISFDIFLGCNDSPGADGIAFVFQPISTSIGTNGGGMGYQGVAPSLAIEFDTYTNGQWGDPFYDHIAIMTNGSGDHGSANNLAGPDYIIPNTNVEDCKFHPCLISWNATTLNLKVFVECDLRLEIDYDMVNEVFGGDPEVYFGFTAGTGAENNKHQICLNYVSTLDQMTDVTICKGSKIQIKASDNFATYEWTPTDGLDNPDIFNPVFSPDQTTTYTVAMYDECGVPVYDDITITVVDLQVEAIVTKHDICDPNSLIDVDIKADGGSGTYTFSVNGVDYQDSNIFTDLSGNDIITAYAKDGNCINTDVIVPVIIRELKDSLLFHKNIECEGELGHLVVEAVGGTPPYVFDLNGAQQNDGNFPDLTIGNYTLTITDANDCVYTKDYEIVDITETYTLSIVEIDDIHCEVPGYARIGLDKDPEGTVTYILNDGQEESADGYFEGMPAGDYEVSVDIIPENSEVHICPIEPVTFTIKDEDECLECITNIPSAFSPNGDGLNDVFLLSRHDVCSFTEFHFAIYNRWGNKVFETNDATLGWDGTFENHPAPLAVYVYELSYTDQDGKSEALKGNVSLVR